MFDEDMKYTNIVIQVGKQSYCYWDFDTEMKRKNIQFIKSIDTDYFTYQADVHADKLDSEHKSSASLALRSAYVHGLESLFSLIVGLVQAPHHLHFWSTQYKINELRECVKSLHHNFNANHAYDIKSGFFNWEKVAEIVLWNSFPDREKVENDIRETAWMWQRFAHDFCNEDIQIEYNSVKHGFRAKQGGFVLGFGLERTPGVRADEKDMNYMGTQHGSTFFFPEKLPKEASDKNSRNIEINSKSLAWIPENLYWGLYNIANSIENIKSALLIMNGEDPKSVKFVRLEDNEDYYLPWKLNTGICSMTGAKPYMTYEIITKVPTKKEIEQISKKRFEAQTAELKKSLKQNKLDNK